MSISIWDDSIVENYDRLYVDKETDVLVIGGGICGLLCAYRLNLAGKRVILVEQNKIASGKTRKTTASITALQDVMYHKLIKSIGYDKAKLYFEANLMAVEEYKRLSNKLDFDFEEVASYKYSLCEIDEIIDEVNTIKDFGYEAEFCKSINLPIKITGAIELKKQGQMNPLKLINSLIKHLEIYEKTKIVKIDEHIAYTDNGNKIYAKNIVVCTGYPFLKLKGLFPLKQYQEKSYVVAIKSDKKICGNVIGLKKEDLYFRNYKDYLIIGGNQIRTGKKNDGYDMIVDFISINGDDKIEYRWINQDCITLDQIPYIGKYGYLDDTYVATGFNLWGMTGAMISSIVICDYILKKHNRYFELFNPNRTMNMVNTIKNIGSATKGLLTPKLKRCSHLGCALNWNEKDNVYECPCHGSLYDKDGNVIDGPAIKKL